MATKTGLEIITRVRSALLDPNGVRWSSADLLDWLNDAQNEITILRPDASTAVRAVALVVGKTLQALPADGLRLFDIVRNMGSDGLTPGRPIRVIEREQLDSLRPTWHSEAGQAEVQSYTYDGRSPKYYYVYPKPAAPLQVEVHLQVVPLKVTMAGVLGGSANSVISLDDIYSTAIFDYVMWRAHYKDTDAQNTAEGREAYQRFLQRLGLKIQVDRTMDPNRNAPPKEVKRAEGGDNAPAF